MDERYDALPYLIGENFSNEDLVAFRKWRDRPGHIRLWHFPILTLAIAEETKGQELTKEAKVKCTQPHKDWRWVKWDARHEARCAKCAAKMEYTGEMRLVEIATPF